MARHIEHRADFGRIRYANCWEDADVLCAALRPAAGRRILSIASAGDNTLALLAEGADVVAADLSLAQLACLELRCAAFRRLTHHQVLQFLGILPATDRGETFLKLEADLSEPARQFWRRHTDIILAGIIHGGKFENYFRTFRRFVLPWIHRKKTAGQLLAEKNRPQRESFYRDQWDNGRWRFLFRVFFSRWVMGRLGRDPEFFRYVEGPVADRLLTRTKHALTVLPTHSNPYLRYILTGNFAEALPRYLLPEKFAAIRAGLDRLTLFQGPIDEAAEQHGAKLFDGFNLSDIFEYLDPKVCRVTYERLLAAASPGARMVYWNMLAPRSCPPELSHRVNPLDELSTALHDQDRAFFYNALVVEEVL